jgi:methyl-accepting chemotaxis protein
MRTNFSNPLHKLDDIDLLSVKLMALTLFSGITALCIVAPPILVNLSESQLQSYLSIKWYLIFFCIMLYALHGALIHLLIRPLALLLEAETDTVFRAGEVVNARGRLLAMPLISALFSGLIWVLFGLLLTIFMRRIFQFDSVLATSTSLFFFAGSLLNGIMIFFLFKQQLAGFAGIVLQYKAGSGGRKHAGRIPFGQRISVNAKILVSFMLLAFVGILISWLVVLGNSTNALNEQRAQLDKGRIFPYIKTIRDRGDEGVETVLQQLSDSSNNNSSETYFYFNRLDNKIIGAPLGISSEKLSTILNNEKGYAFDPSSERLFLFFPTTDNNHLLVMTSSVSGSLAQSAPGSGLNFSVLLTGLIILLLVGLTTLLFARDLSNPIRSMVRPAKRIAEGDLSRIIIDLPDDETGLLAQAISEMTNSVKGNLKSMIEVAQSAEVINEHLDNVIEQVSEQTGIIDSFIGEIQEFFGNFDASYAKLVEEMIDLDSKSKHLFDDFSQSQNFESMFSSYEQALSGSIEEAIVALIDVAGSVTHVSGAIGDLADFGDELQKEVSEITERLSGLTDDLSTIFGSTETLIDSSEKAGTSLGETISQIDRVSEEVTNTEKAVKDQEERIGQVDNIIEIIEMVSNQTKLLSLNASIIAAAGGDTGKNFNVVADEIKDLAERTGTSTSEIYDLFETIKDSGVKILGNIETSIKRIALSKNLSREAQDTVTDIITRATASREEIVSVRNLAKKQKDEITGLDGDMGQLSDILDVLNRSIRDDQSSIDNMIDSVQRMRESARNLSDTWNVEQKEREQMRRMFNEIFGLLDNIRGLTDMQKKERQTLKISLEQITEVGNLNYRYTVDLKKGFTRVRGKTLDLLKEIERFRL